MKNSYYVWALRILMATPMVLVYAFFAYVELMENLAPIDMLEIIRHVILVAGLIPLCSWLTVIFLANHETVGKLLLLAVLITVYHYFLFAVSAHFDGIYYWSGQLVEIIAFLPVVRLALCRKG